ncbi:MAG: hypothetical protein A4E60_03530 [Syntrophorhabdus sp. PtaB.Bin047]|nr:MAG: hypothetical protein A4E60_03530 [Syntrophorhabdus sp. PtaB.Bin047]
MPHSSMGRGKTPTPVIPSTTISVPGRSFTMAATSRTGNMVPVDVSVACM